MLKPIISISNLFNSPQRYKIYFTKTNILYIFLLLRNKSWQNSSLSDTIFSISAHKGKCHHYNTLYVFSQGIIKSYLVKYRAESEKIAKKFCPDVALREATPEQIFENGFVFLRHSFRHCMPWERTHISYSVTGRTLCPWYLWGTRNATSLEEILITYA